MVIVLYPRLVWRRACFGGRWEHLALLQTPAASSESRVMSLIAAPSSSSAPGCTGLASKFFHAGRVEVTHLETASDRSQLCAGPGMNPIQLLTTPHNSS